jgi:hypothetical protein
VKTKTIAASDVRDGQTVTKIMAPGEKRGLRDQGVRKHRGNWPTVTSAEYRVSGEGGLPTVYLMLSDDQRRVFCLSPDDEVTVEVAS